MNKKNKNSLYKGINQIRVFMDTPVSERQVVVHNGVFHADDVFAVALLRLVAGNFKIIRTRSMEYLHEAPGRVVVDVGEDIFDHHGSQSYKVFRHDVGITDEDGDFVEVDVPACGASLLAEILEEMGLIQIGDRLENELISICMQDNGKVWPYKPKISFIQEFNTVFDEDRSLQDAFFEKAVGLVTQIISRMIIADEADIRSEEIVQQLPLDEEVVEVVPGTPWWEKLAFPDSKAKFVIYYGDNDTWYIQCVPESLSDRFSKRVPLPETWTKRPRNQGDFVFCHAGRFIAGFKTREAAVQAAYEALDNP